MNKGTILTPMTKANWTDKLRGFIDKRKTQAANPVQHASFVPSDLKKVTEEARRKK